MQTQRTRLNSVGLITALSGLLLLAACSRSDSPAGDAGPDSATGAGAGVLVFASYTTPREAYTDAILPAFRAAWKAKTGRDVEVRASYQGSGAQSRAIVSGLEADVAGLSLEADIERIAKADLITHDWRAGPQRGMVTRSIVVLCVRAGNPKGIREWTDLTHEGVGILTPDPKTSGGAMWNVNALYGAALRGECGVPKGDAQAAGEFLTRVLANVVSMDKGARESITAFEKGAGDVAITYENEVLAGRANGQTYEMVVPRSTILIENPVAVVDVYAAKHGVRPVAEGLVEFLHGAQAQRAFARHGFRPVDAEVAAETKAQFPEPADLWTIDALGGWSQVMKEIYGPDGVFPRSQEAAARR